ncbi:HD domain-containing protein [Mucilaginibacter aquatilis]|uniref:HD domain-containing protein n=1 Tax=Mucilaginibacter aquatilis TaxID=1517760 RepID=A0A6I4IAK1_9SPHI|nr:HD domain-containing protein [Mucilaginibacter aquatilis]MVN92250.1 HD domain-containing protein [Mucilaginibacter aquatilis]
MTSSQQLINQTAQFVQQTLQNAEGGHDWWHILRVWNNAKMIAKTEPANMLIVELAALLHDIADSKFHNGNEEIGPQTAVTFLKAQNAPEDVIEHVELIIRHMSFKASFDGSQFHSPELAVVQDADRLDAIGAIGIARAFTYGGFKGRELYNPEIKPNLNMSKEEYKNSAAPTINHFYEKLLLLKDKMNTASARKFAEERHRYMEAYLTQFYGEWNGQL